MAGLEQSIAGQNRCAWPAVHSLHSFGFAVPALDIAARFYDSFGLQVRRTADCLDLYTHGHTHLWGRVGETPGVRKKLRYVSFGCYAQDFAAMTDRIVRHGYPECQADVMAPPGGIWVKHPDGYPVQLVVAEKSSPAEKSTPSVRETVNIGRGAASNRSKVPKVQPRRLSHILLFSPDVERATAFYQEALGLRITDRSSDIIVFMHAPHGSDHHLVALVKSNGPGLHHLSWDVASVDEVGSGMEQMLRAGYGGGWGVGRHVLGSNYFYYVRDPWGSYCEYSFDIDYVHEGRVWPAQDHPAEDSFYMWGPAVPEEFVINCETADP